MQIRKTSLLAALSSAALATLLLSGCASTVLPKTGDTALLKAVRRDDASAFDKAIAGDKSLVNTADLMGRSPLMLAAGEGRSQMVSKLIAADAKLNAVDVKGQTALHFAASSGDYASVKALLAAGASRSVKDSYGWTPLTEAARLGNLSAVRALLDAGAPVDVEDCEGKIPLMHGASAKRNSDEIVGLLLDKGSDVMLFDSEGLNPLMWAVKAGNPEAALLILNKMPSLADEREVGFLTMQWAIKCGNLDLVEALVAKGVPLTIATSDFTRIARALQAKGIAKIFANYGLLAENRTPLMWAAIYGQPKIAAFLILKGSDVKAKDNKGNTALDYAKDYATAKVIKEAGLH